MTNAEARFNKIHIRKVYACLAVTCHLHFWQNDRDFLRVTVVTRGWNGYRNKSQHRKSTDRLRRKFSHRSSRDSNPRPFNHESGALTTELSPPPQGGDGKIMCYIVSENILCGQVYIYIYSHARLLGAVGVGCGSVRSVESDSLVVVSH